MFILMNRQNNITRNISKKTINNCLIVVMSTQYPGYGGSATNSYAIVKYLRKSGYNVHGIFVEDAQVDVDPDKLGCVYRIPRYMFFHNIKTSVTYHSSNLIRKFGRPPDLVLCKNYDTPYCSKLLFPTSKVVYMVSGLSNMIKLCKKIPANEVIKNNKTIEADEHDLQAVKCSNYVITNSKLTLDIMKKSMESYMSKIHPVPIDTSKYLITDNFTKIKSLPKIYDFIISASLLSRPEKNNVFLLKFIKLSEFSKYKKLIIGKDNKLFKTIPNSTVLDLVPNNEFVNYLGKSKVLLYPSLYDSNPNTVNEAILAGCLVLVSNNVGNYEKLPPEFVCTSYNVNEWKTKAHYLVQNYSQISNKNITVSNLKNNMNNSELNNLIQDLIKL